MVERAVNELKSIIYSDKIILNYPKHYARDNKVNLHYYHAEWQKEAIGNECNVGDYLSEVIVRWMCANKKIDFDQTIPQKKHLYAIGSILQMGYQNATVWGTGFAFELGGIRKKLHMPLVRKLDIRCVRGPKTRKTLLKLGYSCPENYGDPALLLPLMYRPQKLSSVDYLIIPHYSMENEIRKKYGDKHVLSMNTMNYQYVIDSIYSAQKIISSSLHGLIIADAYGIPAIFCQDRDNKFNYKYEDYYESTERIFCPVHDIETGLKTDTCKLERSKLKKMQNVLLNQFPEDLWGG